MHNVLVYVAGPISKGDLATNIKQACDAGMALLKARIPNIVPHLTCYLGQRYYAEANGGYGTIAPWPEVLPDGTAHADWYGMDLVIVSRCDAVLRLPGESTGADLEVAEAKRLGKPVFDSVADAVAWASDKPERP